MGYYINPPGQTKEQWLETHATLISESTARSYTADDHLVVCLVDNGWMTLPDKTSCPIAAATRRI
jgi:hypothetical protein